MSDRSVKFIRVGLIALSIIGSMLLIVGAVVWFSGGFKTDVFGLRVRATDPWRPIWIGLSLFGARVLFRGDLALDTEIRAVRRALRPPVIAAVLAALITCVALGTNYGVAGGADAYGYVSQADLWLARDLTVEQEWVRGAPWPNTLFTAAPLSYRPAASGFAVVPGYAPGLPLLLAGGKMLLGQCGFVAVIATMAGLLVAATYALGRRLATPQVGAAAAWLVATSPVVLFMMASPMSDVPAAAMLAVTLLGCLHRSKKGALLGGLSMAVVILIRPNLTPLVALVGLWLLVLDRQTATWPERVMRSALFGLGLAPAAAVLALVNVSLHGSATSSGYGNLEGFFSTSHILPNLRNYSSWLFESQTPFAVVGLLSLAVPARWLSKKQPLCDVSLLMLMAGGVIATYLPYLVFDAWWFLRFLLPAWPAVAIGTAWLLTDTTGRTYGRVGLTSLLFLGGWGLRFAYIHDAFEVGAGELRYVSAAHVVREVTAPTSVILSMQHSGSVTYYAGRHVLRYDWLETHRLDSAIDWLKERGHDVYILLEEPEMENFRARFAGTRTGSLAEETLIFRQDVGTRVFLFDTRSHLGERPRTITDFVPSARRCCEPSRAERR